ncbi:MAG: hypothetical protein AB1798_10725 [Spirochaetota bacterium]
MNNEIEAQVMEGILNEREIPHYIRSFNDSAYNGLFQLEKGWGYIETPEEYVEEIKSIYAELKKSRKGED